MACVLSPSYSCSLRRERILSHYKPSLLPDQVVVTWQGLINFPPKALWSAQSDLWHSWAIVNKHPLCKKEDRMRCVTGITVHRPCHSCGIRVPVDLSLSLSTSSGYWFIETNIWGRFGQLHSEETRDRRLLQYRITRNVLLPINDGWSSGFIVESVLMLLLLLLLLYSMNICSCVM